PAGPAAGRLGAGDPGTAAGFRGARTRPGPGPGFGARPARGAAGMKYVLMGLIRLYQLTISRMLGPVCRYYPSCSHYGYEAIAVHGSVKGSILTAWRILRCNPWSAGGVDPV